MSKDFLSVLFLLTLVVLLTRVSAVCEDGQIDINSASTEELKEIIWVGNSVAQQIIDNRPFDSLDNLDTKIGFIGPSRLADIKSQNLACVEEENNGEIIEEEPVNNSTLDALVVENVSAPVNKNLQPIELKSESAENLNKNNYTIYGLVGFGVLVIALLALKNKRKEKLV